MQMAHKLAYVEVQGKREMHLLMAVEQNYTPMQEAHQTCRVTRVTTGEKLPDDQQYFN